MIDGIDYAVKKVSLARGVLDEHARRVLREVKLFAMFDDINIVRFYNAWVEPVSDNNMPAELQGSDDTMESSLLTQDSFVIDTLESGPGSSLISQSQPFFSLYGESTREESDSSSSFSDPSSRNCPFQFEDSYPLNYTTDISFNRDTVESSQSSESSKSSQSSGSSKSSQSSKFAKSSQPCEKESSKESSVEKNASFTKLMQQRPLMLYIQMAYCGRRTLETYLQDANRVVCENELLDVCMQLCHALTYIHKKHIIHRDVKPANIFYGEDKVVRLGDFGLSRIISDGDLVSFSSGFHV